jgi:hypothetical protein
MSPVEALQALIVQGVDFATDGKMVRWRNADGWITPEVLAILKAGKAEIIAYLIARGAGAR